MLHTFKVSENLRDSIVKNKLMRGFFVVALAYMVRALYSAFFSLTANIEWPRFYKLGGQILVNLLMDIPVISVILYINRRTIEMRKLIEAENARRKAKDADRLFVTRSFIDQCQRNAEESQRGGSQDDSSESLDRDTSVSDIYARDELLYHEPTLSEDQKVREIMELEYKRWRQREAERFIMLDQNQGLDTEKMTN